MMGKILIMRKQNILHGHTVDAALEGSTEGDSIQHLSSSGDAVLGEGLSEGLDVAGLSLVVNHELLLLLGKDEDVEGAGFLGLHSSC